MKNTHYRYSTKEISRFYGLTGKGLAFYEEKGIISPQRKENGKYRIFTLSDCYSLYQSKLYANCGFTLNETAKLLQEKTLDEALMLINKQTELQAMKLRQEKRILECTRHILDTLNDYRRKTPFVVTTSPEFYRLFVRHYKNEHISTPKQSAEFEQWNALIPINTASLKISYDELNKQLDTLNVNIGNIITKEDFEAFHFIQSPQVEHIMPQKCVYTILKIECDAINTLDWLTPALHQLKEHGYTCNGDLFTSMLLTANENGQKVRYDEVWIPIQ